MSKFVNNLKGASNIGILFFIIALIIAVGIIERGGVFSSENTEIEITNLEFLSESNTNLTITYVEELTGDTELIDFFNISMYDQYSNIYYLEPKLVFITTGNDYMNESEPELGNFTWTEYSYALVRTYGPGNGDFGDSVAFLQIWDTSNSTVFDFDSIYEFSRSGWGRYRIDVNNTNVWDIDSLFPTYTPPAKGFVEGELNYDGSHTP